MNCIGPTCVSLTEEEFSGRLEAAAPGTVANEKGKNVLKVMIMRMVFIINTYDALRAIFIAKITFFIDMPQNPVGDQIGAKYYFGDLMFN
ncbi:hypothetical protein LNP26_12665 [Klebsiella variicola subsp. variicola]|nr:hypothetical protein [Klebsiella variicola subsp. variicola]